MRRSACSTAGSAGSPSLGRSSTSCRASRSSTWATPSTRRTGRSRSPTCARYALGGARRHGRVRREGARDRLQHGVARRCCRDARERLPRPPASRWSRSSSPPCARAVRHDPQRPDRGDRHRRARSSPRAYDDAFAAAPGIELFTQACPRFVEFVEAGVTSGDRAARGRRGVPRRCSRPRTSTRSCSAAPTTRSCRAAIQYVMGPDSAARSRATERDRVRRLPHARRPRHPAQRRPEPRPATRLRGHRRGSADAFLRLAHRLLGPEIVRASSYRASTGQPSARSRPENASLTRRLEPRARRRPHGRPAAPDHHRARLERARPRAPRSSRSAAPRCCAPRRSRTACRAG